MSSKVSRRRMIFAGGGTLIACTALRLEPRAKGDETSLLASDREISAIPGSDSRFGTAVETLYPRLQRDPVFQKLAPLAVLITLENGPGIRAHSISWAITTPHGTYKTALFFYVSPGSAANGHSVSTLGSARQNIIQAGQSRLITPFFNWTPSYYQGGSTLAWSKVLKQVEPGKFLMSELATATAVRVSVDGAIFSDWKILGPDEHHLAWRVRARRNAEHDEGLVVYKLLKVGAPDSVIANTLRSHSTAQRSSATPQTQRWYEQARRFQAQILLRAFEDSDRDIFTKAVIRLKKQPKTIITKVIA